MTSGTGRHVVVAWRGVIATTRQFRGHPSSRRLSTSTSYEKVAEEKVPLKLESWVQGQLMRAIGQVLLDAERYTMNKKTLMELLEQAGAVRSYLHFRESLRMMEKMKRIEVYCKGPVKIGSRERKFFVFLTSRGQRVYSWHRLNPNAGSGTDHASTDTNKVATNRGLTDAL